MAQSDFVSIIPEFHFTFKYNTLFMGVGVQFLIQSLV